MNTSLRIIGMITVSVILSLLALYLSACNKSRSNIIGGNVISFAFNPSNNFGGPLNTDIDGDGNNDRGIRDDSIGGQQGTDDIGELNIVHNNTLYVAGTTTVGLNDEAVFVRRYNPYNGQTFNILYNFTQGTIVMNNLLNNTINLEEFEDIEFTQTHFFVLSSNEVGVL
ncbi:MAG: hypothetical protein ABDH21_02350 [bacterium]